MDNERTNERDKYIKLISQESNRYGDKLLAMMDYYGVTSLKELTATQTKEYYEKHIKNTQE